MRTYKIDLVAKLLLCVALGFGLPVTRVTAQPSLNQTAAAQTAESPTPYAISEIGANYRIWQSTSYETRPDGTTVPHLHQYTELASGLYYRTNGLWVESREEIEPYATGAIAQQGQYQVIFANNLNSPSAIDTQTTDGKRLRSNILGLAFYDRSTSNTVMIAEIQDCQGELISDNQVLYTNAFAGLVADVRYTYKCGSFEQDVILHQQPPGPGSLGLNPATTEIEVITELIEPPEASVYDPGTDDLGVAGDEDIGWGAMSLGHGKAFDLDGQEVPSAVTKRYLTIDGRYFLLEKVKWTDIQAALANLPDQASASRPFPTLASKAKFAPQRPNGKNDSRPIRMTAKTPPSKGFVMDYTLLNSSYTNYIFQGDTTYYISGALNLGGTNTFEGGAVLKFTNGASLSIANNFYCKSTAYRPIIFTAKDDNAVGQPISGSTGNPHTNFYANPALSVTSVKNGATFANFRICYAQQAIFSSGSVFALADGQIVDCQNGISVTSTSSGLSGLGAYNLLFANVLTNFNQVNTTRTSYIVTNVNSTFSGSYCLMSVVSTVANFAYQNCIFCNVSNFLNFSGPNDSSLSITGDHNGFYNSLLTNSFFSLTSPVTNTFYPFQSVGAGGYYLNPNCAFTNAGNGGVGNYVLTNLASRTTYAPIICSNLTFSVPTNFGTQVARDNTGNPSLGYHYDPLDYVFGAVTVSSNISFSAGTAVGWFNGGSGVGYGIYLNGTAQTTLAGSATNPCILARNDMVQETVNNLWTNYSTLGGFVAYGGNSAPSTAPVLNLDFTHCYAHNYEGEFFCDYGDGTLLLVNALNSEFYSGDAVGAYVQLDFTNCLGARASLGANNSGSATAVTMRNCTFYGGNLAANRTSGSTWPVVVENTAFDATTFTNFNAPSGGLTNVTYCNFNSFDLGAARTPEEGANDLTITNGYNWQTNWFGNYYSPTNSRLIQAGSTTANLIGLYHFTTQTNQMPEGDAVVDIGYHYVAVGANGQPLDSNGDGIPDYLADANGDGIYDAGDLVNWLISPFNGLSSANGLSVFTPLQ